MSNRRGFIREFAGAGIGTLIAGGLSNTLGLNTAFAADELPKKKNKGPLAELIKTTSECIRTGEACVAHCQKELSEGHTSMARCNEKVHDMLALTRAMLSLASYDSALAAKLAPICAEACKSCADACGEHKEHFAHGMHLACKECMEACIACEKACRKLTA